MPWYTIPVRKFEIQPTLVPTYALFAIRKIDQNEYENIFECTKMNI